MRATFLYNPIAENELIIAIRQQSPNKALGIDDIPSGILKPNRNWRMGELASFLKNNLPIKHPSGWQNGIMISLRKSC